jgi:hypothetical protein
LLKFYFYLKTKRLRLEKLVLQRKIDDRTKQIKSQNIELAGKNEDLKKAVAELILDNMRYKKSLGM